MNATYSTQGISFFVSGCLSYPFNVLTSFPRMPQNMSTRDRPSHVPCRNRLVPVKPSLSPHRHGLMNVRNLVTTSFSSHFLSGVTYAGAIHTGPWPDSRMTQSTLTPLEANM